MFAQRLTEEREVAVVLTIYTGQYWPGTLTPLGTRRTRSQATSDPASPDSPIDIPLRAIAAGCPPGGHVLDPFSGAGTTGLAALQLGRAYSGIDISATFHDQALGRLAPHLSDTDQSPGGGG